MTASPWARLRHLAQDLRSLDVVLAARRSVSLAGLPPTVSFTFDDFPASAAQRGAEILEQAGLRGTFYLSGGLLGQASEHGPMAGAGDIKRLAETGHEIGCHTFGHLGAAQTNPEAFALDLERNGRAVAELLGGQAMSSFAFPYGSVTPGAKAAAARLFSSSRTTRRRVNRGRADMNLLAAFPLYEREGLHALALDLLQDCARHGGWLILYTHDVADRPSSCGCTPDQLALCVRAAQDLGLAVAPVGQVAARLGRAEER